ncbi:MAG: MMPL family transporter, partial [Dehalococcoidia bacterium]|nr:MMPL family transporter [Dehalococcoidia bacterium]
AALYFLTHYIDLSIFAMNISTMLGLGLGIDYSLLLISRFREEIARDGDVLRSIETTVSKAGKAVFFSGAIVVIGLSGMLTFPFVALRSLAYGGMIVVSFSMLAALTLVPAALGVLGPRINRLAVRRNGATGGSGGFWQRLAKTVMRHPVVVIAVVLAIVFTFASPLLRIELGTPDASVLPAELASRQGADLLKSEFGEGETSPILIVLGSDSDMLSPGNVGAAYDLTKKLEADSRVKRVDGLFNLDPRLTREQLVALYSGPRPIAVPALALAVDKMSTKNITYLSVVGKLPPMSKDARKLVSELRAMNPGGDLTIQVGGLTAIAIDMEKSLYADFPKAIAIVVAATFIALLILFRSVVLPLKAVVVNTLSIAASYGVLVFIFQDGNLSNLLHFTPQGHIDSTLPIMLFCILFGLSMDYEVFLLTRVKEAYDQTGNNEQAIVIGLERTGRIITSAAAVMVAVTLSFGMTDLIPIKAMGIGAAIAIALDATIVRALLVPATMRLLGEWNWWAPGFIKERRGINID